MGQGIAPFFGILRGFLVAQLNVIPTKSIMHSDDNLIFFHPIIFL